METTVSARARMRAAYARIAAMGRPVAWIAVRPEEDALAGEAWRPPTAGRFVADLPEPMGIGTARPRAGASATGFRCEALALVGASDITSSGGWRASRSVR
ncbi:MAG: hypothetical protein QM622_09755 [Microbacterium sp.]